MELSKDSKSYFDVLGICCSSEVPMIEKLLKNLQGVKEVSVIVPTKTVIVVHDSLVVSQIQIVKALNRERLEANIRVYGEQNYKNKWPSPYAMASGSLLLLSFLKYVYSPLQWLAVGAIAIGIIPILLKAFAAVSNFSLDVNILVLIAVAGSVTLRDYWEAATIVFLFTIAEWLESRASHKATAAMSSLVSLVPQKAVLAETGEEINADKVILNTVLVVKAGEIIPIDGVVLEGNCEVDEKILTGESFPVSKEKDSTVWASTINLNGYITIRTTAVVEDCVVSRMAKLVEEAQNKKSRTQRLLDKCAKYYTPAIVLISACLAIVPLLLHVKNQNEWYHLALVVLVSGCPCALLLSTPVAMFCALSKAATMGVLFKGAEHVETLAEIKIMAFDKTGTITRGEFLVSDVKPLCDDISLNTILYWISSIESKSSHPMAAALVDFARAQGVEPKPDEVEKYQNFPGEGIRGNIGDNEIYIGNRKIASRTGCTAVPNIEGYETEGKSVGYVFLGSLPIGIFCIDDVCRTGAKEAIRELKLLGIKTAMLTGDSNAAAKHTQAQLMDALEMIHSELLPEDKARIIREFQKEGPTAMIGDGINDALALTTANVGISMGVSGSALATESGDIILMSNDIQKVPKAVRLARKVRRKIIENVIISITTKAGIVGLAIAGHPLVWAAVLTDVGTCLLVICNSMLLLKGMPKREHKSCKSGHKHQHKHDHDDHHSSCSDLESQKKVASGCCTSSDASLRAHMLSSSKENGHKAHDHHSHHHHQVAQESVLKVHKHGSCDHNHNHKHDHHSSISDIESKMKVASACCTSDTSSRAHMKEHGHKAHDHSHHHHKVAQEVQKHGSCDHDHVHDHHSSISDIESQMKVASECCSSSDTSSSAHRKENGHKKHHESILEVHKHGCCETRGMEKNCIAKHKCITSC